MQESEARQSGATSRVGKSLGGGGGLLPSLIAIGIIGGICWQWLIPPLASGEPSAPPEGGSISELAPVDPQDVPGALGTMAGSADFLARMKKAAADDCSRPLAWVSIVQEPGQPAATVRLRSGNYFSPMFKLSDVPTRVAIPYPAPYENGQGKLTILGESGQAAVALRPTWHVVLQGGGAVRNVTWHPSRRCTLPNG